MEVNGFRFSRCVCFKQETMFRGWLPPACLLGFPTGRTSKPRPPAPVSPDLPWPPTPSISAHDDALGIPRTSPPQPACHVIISFPPSSPGNRTAECPAGTRQAPAARGLHPPPCPHRRLSPVRQDTPRGPRSQSSSGVPERRPVSRSVLPPSAEMPALVQPHAGATLPPWR